MLFLTVWEGGEYGEIASYIAAKATEQYLNAEEAANLAGKKDYLGKNVHPRK